MLKKLRIKFICIAMLAFSVVILSLAVGINLFNYHSIQVRLDEKLGDILAFEKILPDMEQEMEPEEMWEMIPNDYDPEFNYTTRFFSVMLDENGEVSFVHVDYISAVKEEDASGLALEVADSGRTHGFLDGYRYLCQREDNFTYVVFLNSASELHAVKVLALMSCIVVICSLLCVFVLVIVLSGRAILPFAENVERQKRFVTDASHELKTPVTSIAASTDVLEMEFGENEWFDDMHSQITRLTALIRQLVTLSRLDEELPLPEKETFSMSDAVWEVADPFVRQAKSRGKTCSLRVADDIDYRGEESMIKQMLSVLLDNAVKYSDAVGNIEIQLIKKHNRIILSISNTFDGVQEKKPERLFDRFYRSDMARSEKTGGHGIGLSMAKAIAEAHGGRITVKYTGQNVILFEVVL